MEISVLEVVVCLSEIIDLMSEEIRDHHKKVACASYYLAKEMGFEKEELRDIVFAAALHDIGGLSLEARKCATLHFEDTNSHAERGYKLLSVFEPLENVATIIRYHHTKWKYGKSVSVEGGKVPVQSEILLMADRISVMLTPGIHTLNQAHTIISRIEEKEGEVYPPYLIEAFKALYTKDVFWLDIMSQEFYDKIMIELREYDIHLSNDYVEEMLDLLSSIVDFRSVFTTVHSKGVAVVAQELARLMHLPTEECYVVRVAALLHDIGKLAVPTEIIEKPGPLTEYERDIVRTHSYYTHRVLSKLSGFERVCAWASFHHENLDGSGYPFGVQEESLNLGSKIMKVADVFVALTENRPYREGMSGKDALIILNDMANKGQIDAKVVNVLVSNLAEIEELRLQVEKKAILQYENFMNF